MKTLRTIGGVEKCGVLISVRKEKMSGPARGHAKDDLTSLQAKFLWRGGHVTYSSLNSEHSLLTHTFAGSTNADRML